MSRSVEVRTDKPLNTSQDLFLCPWFVKDFILDVSTSENCFWNRVTSGVSERRTHCAEHLPAISNSLLNNNLKELLLETGQNREILDEQNQLLAIPQKFFADCLEYVAHCRVKAEETLFSF